MTVSKARKSEQLAALESELKEATCIGFTSNQKITVAEVSEMKRELRSQNAYFLVAKKTLIRIAFKNVYNTDLDISTLPGQVAIVISKGDKVAGLSVANKYAKLWKKEEKLVFVGGYLDGRIMDATETTKLAGLPSREVLLAKLLGSMMSPLSGLARFFDAAKKDLEAKGLTKVGDLTASAPVAAVKVEAPVAATETPKVEEVAAPSVEVAPEAPVADVAAETPAEAPTIEEPKAE